MKRVKEIMKRSGVSQLVVIAAIVAVATTVWTSYAYFSAPDVQASRQARALATKVARQTTVPSNEVPVILQIDNIDLLRDQPFFANAQNGDSILLFQSTQQAIVYREATDTIIASGQLGSLPRQ